MAKDITRKRSTTSEKDRHDGPDNQTKKKDDEANKDNDKNPTKGRRPPPPPLFRFYKISRLHRLHPWVNHHTTFAQTRPEETGYTSQECSGVTEQLKDFLRCSCCPSRFLKLSFLEYKDEITMVVQGLCILLGFLFLILAAATREEPTNTNDSTTVTPATASTTLATMNTGITPIDAMSTSTDVTTTAGTTETCKTSDET
ncbi:uncharacterized protein LOC122262109, partial [Penaeus japonicus]|uniref:uncharacterized protein LOC122262109 n=1 Tax=Penaeus japonicus TaxID=27405 RepID=UPI001C70C279